MAPPAAQAQGLGLFGQMASTAAGVAIGSSVGHAIGGFFGGGSSTAEAAPQQAVQTQDQNAQQHEFGNNCQSAVLNFNKCMDEQGGDMQICNWYLDQLKACQAAARPY
ncbi:CHCH domain protein [Ophiocordyceps sinensis CO18]|nr:CHCH domain protein [Ophiocordyceps sinensis CO18]